MKTIKKLFILSLGVTLLIPNFIYAKSFKDLTKNGQYKWAYESVDNLSNMNILSGYEDGSFKPERAVSFLEVLQIIKNIKNPSQDIVQESLDKFKTVADANSVPAWATEAVCYNLNINTITENTLKAANSRGFLKDKNVTFPDRNSVTVYFGRAFNIEKANNFDNLKHKDLDQVPDMVKSYLSSFVKLDIYASTGSNGYFNGKKYIRRSELAMVANNILKNIENGNIDNSSQTNNDDNLNTDSLLPDNLDTPDNNEIIDNNLTRGIISDLTIKGKNSTINIDGKQYKYDSENLIVDGEKINPAYLTSLIGKEYELTIVDNVLVEIKSLSESSIGIAEDGENVELTVKVISNDQDGMLVNIMISNHSKYNSGLDIKLKSRESFSVGDILQVKAKYIDDHLEDLKVKKI